MHNALATCSCKFTSYSLFLNDPVILAFKFVKCVGKCFCYDSFLTQQSHSKVCPMDNNMEEVILYKTLIERNLVHMACPEIPGS